MGALGRGALPQVGGLPTARLGRGKFCESPLVSFGGTLSGSTDPIAHRTAAQPGEPAGPHRLRRPQRWALGRAPRRPQAGGRLLGPARRLPAHLLRQRRAPRPGPLASHRSASNRPRIHPPIHPPTNTIYQSINPSLGQVPWEVGRGRVAGMGWTEAEELVVVMETGHVHWFSALGTFQQQQGLYCVRVPALFGCPPGNSSYLTSLLQGNGWRGRHP